MEMREGKSDANWKPAYEFWAAASDELKRELCSRANVDPEGDGETLTIDCPFWYLPNELKVTIYESREFRGDAESSMDELITIARAAIAAGRTRGQFIRENAPTGLQLLEDLQPWSDAYTSAMGSESDAEMERRLRG